MSEKNVETEKKNGIGKSTMSKEQMEQFINENLSVVPRNCRRKFESLVTVEEKFTKIRYFLDAKKLRDEMVEKNKLESKVKELFIKRKATTEDVVRVIDFCKQYIQSTKEDEIKKINGEIQRLTHLKQTLESE